MKTPNSPGQRHPRPLTRFSHRQCTASTTRRLLFMVRRSLCELSKTAFIPVYCAIVRPHLECAMEANAPTPRADINQLERVQRLATRLVRGLRHAPYEERLRQLNFFSLKRLRADLISAFKIFKGEVDLSPSDFFHRPSRAVLKEHTYRCTGCCKDQAVKRCLFGSGRDCRHA